LTTSIDEPAIGYTSAAIDRVGAPNTLYGRRFWVIPSE
jgi:hypothetical protein